MLERYAEARERLKFGSRKLRKGCSDVIVRESPDELTLRVEEVNTSKALINVNHIEPERWSPVLVDADWYAFCQPLYKGIEGEDWEEMYDSYRVMNVAVGVKKPQEAQKARALWAMKAAKDRREEFYDPAREDNVLERSKTRLELWKEHLKDPIAALDKASNCVESQY